MVPRRPRQPVSSAPILLSQGEVRPGMVQGQHWGDAPSDECAIPPKGPTRQIVRFERFDPYAARSEWIDVVMA